MSVRISPYQATFLVATITSGHLVIFNSLGQELGRDIWMAQVLATVAGLLYTLLVARILRAYPQMTLGDIFYRVFGRRWGRVFLLVILADVLFTAGNLLSSLVYFWGRLDMPKTPAVVYFLIIIIMCLWSARGGLEPLARVSGLIVCSFLLISLLNLAFLFRELNFANFLPLFRVEAGVLWKNAGLFFLTQYSLLPLVFYCLPYVPQKKEKGRIRALFGGVAITASYFLYSSLRNMLVMGDAVKVASYPAVQILRMVEWSSSISRLELMGIMLIVAYGIFYLQLAFFCACRMGEELLGPQRSRKIVIITAALFALATQLLYSLTRNSIEGTVITIVYLFFFAQLLFFLAAYRKRKKNLS